MAFSFGNVGVISPVLCLAEFPDIIGVVVLGIVVPVVEIAVVFRDASTANQEEQPVSIDGSLLLSQPHVVPPAATDRVLRR